MSYPQQPPPYSQQQPKPQQWGQQPPAGYSNYPPQPPPAKKTPKWAWIVGGVAVLALFGSCSSFGDGVEQGYTAAITPTSAPLPVAQAPLPSTVAAPTSIVAPVVDVVLPDVKGRNGAIVFDELQELGLTNVSYASRDAADKVVLYVANWTAVKIEPKAGSTVQSDQAVVVTMTKTG